MKEKMFRNDPSFQTSKVTALSTRHEFQNRIFGDDASSTDDSIDHNDDYASSTDDSIDHNDDATSADDSIDHNDGDGSTTDDNGGFWHWWW